MKFSVVKRQLLEDQVQTAKSLLSYSSDIERNGDIEFNPYLKSEIARLQKYIDQLSVKPKSPFSMYRRTEEEDLSYCLHKKHTKSMETLSSLIKNINKELYRLKKLKQAEKKLEFLEVFNRTQPIQKGEEGILQNQTSKVQYKLPESKSFIPQLSTPPKFEPHFQTDIEDEKPPEMSRAMESFLIQQEKDRKEKEQRQQNPDVKNQSTSVPKHLISSDKRGSLQEKDINQLKSANNNNNNNNGNEKKIGENPLRASTEQKHVSLKETDKTSPESPRKFSFAGLRQSGGPTFNSPHARPYTSSDPEIPYGAYTETHGPLPHYISTFGRSSGGTTVEGQTKSDEKSRGTI